jgi:RNA-binding protein
MSPAPVLTTRARARLKALAHSLEPILQVGKTGVQDSVVAELDRALTAHELVKLKINDPDREAREATAIALSTRTDSAVVQRVGKVVILWRPRPEEESAHDSAHGRPRKER